RLLPALALVAFLLALPALLQGCAKARRAEAPLAVPAGGFELVLLHTNDTHTYIAGADASGRACFKEDGCYGGYARIAQAIKNEKAKGGNVLALDAGDQMQGTIFFATGKAPLIASLQKRMPYDFSTLGNHEFDDGCPALARFLAELPYGVLACNLKPDKGCPLASSAVKPWAVREFQGVKVGVFGIANDAPVGTSDACKATKFLDRTQAARQAVRELEAQGCRIIVAVTHIGLEDDLALARSVDGIDVIVGGHSHSYLGPETNGGLKEKPEGPYPLVASSPSGKPVLVVTAKFQTRYLGRLDVAFDAEGKACAWQGGPVLLGPDAPRDPEISALVAPKGEELERLKKDRLFENGVDMPDGIEACRQGECLAGILAADAFLEFGRPHGATIAFMHAGGVRSSLPSGWVTRGDMLSVHPFAAHVAVKEITGATIIESLENSVADGHDGAYLLQPAGLSFVLDMRRPSGHRLVKAEAMGADGRMHPLNPRARYRVAMADFLARGSGGHPMLGRGRTLALSDETERELVERHAARISPLRTIGTGRFEILR
ncbi:MAG: bifunctional metallophosphatase/5'-nucleotidase, partial [Desulfovibrio sp.]|nr:bifunctional metallophosphatase/5'-nucleotidase [Desulfovibrio sp.]